MRRVINFLSCYSYIFFTAFILFIAGYFVLRYGMNPGNISILAIVVLLLVLARSGSKIRSAPVHKLAELEDVLAKEKPTLIEFYSKMCIACMAANPLVDFLNEELVKEKVTFLRLEYNESSAQKLAQQYKVDVLPTFLLLDQKGEVLWRKIILIPTREEVMYHMKTDLRQL